MANNIKQAHSYSVGNSMDDCGLPQDRIKAVAAGKGAFLRITAKPDQVLLQQTSISLVKSYTVHLNNFNILYAVIDVDPSHSEPHILNEDRAIQFTSLSSGKTTTHFEKRDGFRKNMHSNLRFGVNRCKAWYQVWGFGALHVPRKKCRNELMNKKPPGPLVCNNHYLLGIVISNLIDNANNNTHKGSIVVESAKTDKEIMIMITDTDTAMLEHTVQWLNLLGETSGHDKRTGSGPGIGLLITK